MLAAVTGTGVALISLGVTILIAVVTAAFILGSRQGATDAKVDAVVDTVEDMREDMRDLRNVVGAAFGAPGRPPTSRRAHG